MAHWIITNNYITRVYKCSECGSEYNDSVYSPDEWKSCPHCKEEFVKDEKIDYTVTAVEPGPTKDVVILSIEKYDAMKDEFNICIEERDRALSILDKELREVTEERDRYLDILKKIEIHKYIGKIVKNSIQVDEFDNPADLTKMVKVTFKVEV